MHEPLSASTTAQPRQSALFTVRLWCEPLDDHWEWRGKVQHVTSGEVRYFRTWESLIVIIQEILAKLDDCERNAHL